MKLELGDIKMDSESGIQVGPSARQVVHAIPTQPPKSDVHEIATMPWSNAMVAPILGIALVALLALLMVLAGQPAWLAATLLLTLQIPLAGLFLWARSKNAAAHRAALAHASWAQDTKRLLEVFSHSPTPKTVTQLCGILSLPEARVLELVTALLGSDELDEDVDLESGQFVYRAVEKFTLGTDHQSAAERLQQTQRQLAIPMESK
ncbi:MAG: hypothetical protein R3E66_24915 [bacterium]